MNKITAAFSLIFTIAAICFFINIYVGITLLMCILIAVSALLIVALFVGITKLIPLLKRTYRLSLNPTKRDNFVWNYLKKFHYEHNIKCGVYESDKYIDVVLCITEDDEPALQFRYSIFDSYLHSKALIITNFPTELTTDVFILSQHFNNLLQRGCVSVDVENHQVTYSDFMETIIPLLYTGEIDRHIISHYNTSKDVFWAFQKLVEENEAPAIIIADLLKKIEDEREKAEILKEIEENDLSKEAEEEKRQSAERLQRFIQSQQSPDTLTLT